MKQISRRNFFKFCTGTTAGLGLQPFDIIGLSKALANSTAPTVLWLQGSACSGCTMSFLDYISPTAPTDAADVLIDYINLAYHPELLAAAGQSVASVIQQAQQSGNYILALEGGVPTGFNGGACYAWSANGVDATFQQAVMTLAPGAKAVLCLGTCSSFGGIPAAPPNPAGVMSVKSATGRSTINIGGFPPHPSWMVWAIVQLLQGKTIAVDPSGRPSSIYGTSVHNQCPNRGTQKATTYGVLNHCLLNLGCRGPLTGANCPNQRWNNGVNWCIGAGSPCLGCTSSTFPGTSSFNQ
jgi:hydrogenase small subunit